MKYIGTPFQKGIGVLESDNTLYFNIEDIYKIFEYESIEDMLSNVSEEYIRYKTDIHNEIEYKLVDIRGFYEAAKSAPNVSARNMVNDLVEYISQVLDVDIDNDIGI